MIYFSQWKSQKSQKSTLWQWKGMPPKTTSNFTQLRQVFPISVPLFKSVNSQAKVQLSGGIPFQAPKLKRSYAGRNSSSRVFWAQQKSNSPLPDSRAQTQLKILRVDSLFFSKKSLCFPSPHFLKIWSFYFNRCRWIVSFLSSNAALSNQFRHFKN